MWMGLKAGRQGSVRVWVCRAPRPELQGAEDPQRSSRSPRNSLIDTGRVFRGVMDSLPLSLSHTHTHIHSSWDRVLPPAPKSSLRILYCPYPLFSPYL